MASYSAYPSYLSQLNPEQLTAVTLEQGSALVLAGAGSGKTRVLTTRIAHLLHACGISQNEVLAVTFTNKAAKEMLLRLSSMTAANLRGVWIGTFHGLCNRMLRAHHQAVRLPSTFQILDSQDQLGAVKRLLKLLNVDTEKFPPREVQYFINAEKEKGVRADRVVAGDSRGRKLQELYAAYDEQCQREGVVDFAELLLRCYELVSRDDMLRAHYQSRFKHILVDEFQDTNRLQYLWLKLLAGGHSQIFAVGDDDQSIYAFRGANVGNMQAFQRDFNVETIIRLEQNYRSHGNILDAANALISRNEKRLGKNLWTSEGSGEAIRVFTAENDQEEASFIVDEVKYLQAEGVALDHMAVLYRSNAQSRVLEHALFSAGISYRVYGGLRFFERQEIKHALAYLRLIANPDDDNALLRIINFPARGIGARSLEQLQSVALQQGSSLWQAALRGAEGSTDAAKKGIAGFVRLVSDMRTAVENLNLPEIIDHVLVASGLERQYQAEKIDADRLENLHELVNAAAAFIQDNEDPSLSAFLSHAALEAGEHQAGVGEHALQLMTVHSAKGLEFHSVFISGLEEGLFPHENSFNQVDGLEEERRLMYVALTRARRRAYLSFAEKRMLHGQFRYGIPSRFVSEIPAQLLQAMNRKKVAHTAFYSPGSAPASSRVSASSPLDSSPWRIGQNVLHAKFGSGVIINCEGRGRDARVQVNFAHSGVKWLALEYAKLSASA